ncbi:MAG: MFS transporter [Verrucomicrobiota bacterium]
MSLSPRQRDLVLSLKYSTIEACFSVPMLNITMPNLPFLLAFVTAQLRWPSWAIGFLAALPHLCNCIQPPISRWLERHWSLQTIMRWGFVLSAVPWFFVGASSIVSPRVANIAFSVLLTIATLANSVTSVAWSASISQLVPNRIAGKYYGKRNLIFGAWTLFAVLLAGKIVDFAQDKSFAFSCIFSAAGLCRLFGLFFLRRMKFPSGVTQRREATYRLKEMLRPLLDSNYRNYMLFVGCWGLFLNMGLPFYTVYLIRDLHFELGLTVILATVGTLGGILTLHSWGLLSDRFGSKPVQYVCSYIWIAIGLVGWLIAGPKLQAHLFFVYLVVGGATAGFQLTQFNLMVKLIPQGSGSLYIAVFLAVTSALTMLGPIAGGALLAITPNRLGTVLGQPLLDFHLLILVSFAGCLASLPFLTSAQEPASEKVQSVWRTMLRMRAFNPLLAMTNAAGFLFTPRGALSLGKYSVRSFRREIRKVVDVGSELISGGQELVKERFIAPNIVNDRRETESRDPKQN